MHDIFNFIFEYEIFKVRFIHYKFTQLFTLKRKDFLSPFALIFINILS